MIQLKFCTVAWRDDGAVWTTFEDGAECPATSHDTHHYHVIAHRLGYGDDVAAYTFEHELMHSFVSEWFHDKPSPVLWAIAHGEMLSGKDAAYEEIVAQTAQRWLRANERPILGGVDWDRFKASALAVLAGAN